MEAAAGVSLGFLHSIVGEEVGDFRDEARGNEGLFDIVALKINIGIDLVGDAVVALIAFESDVVGCGAEPQRLALNLERGFPDAQMVARTDDTDGFGMGPAVILRTAKEIELAHAHGQGGLFGEAPDDAMENSVPYVGVDFDPASGSENALHGGLGAEHQEINHITGIAFLVADATRELGEEIVVAPGK